MLTNGIISQLNKIDLILFNLKYYEKARLFEININ